MRILCAIGLRGGPGMIERIAKFNQGQSEFFLLHVIDAGPHHELNEIMRSAAWGRSRTSSGEDELLSAEQAAGQAVIDEAIGIAKKLGIQVKNTSIARGKPEQVIIDSIREHKVDLVVIWSREGSVGHPRFGPASIGHTTRFVLDHAPCDVLLLREPKSEP